MSFVILLFVLLWLLLRFYIPRIFFEQSTIHYPDGDSLAELKCLDSGVDSGADRAGNSRRSQRGLQGGVSTGCLLRA